MLMVCAGIPAISECSTRPGGLEELRFSLSCDKPELITHLCLFCISRLVVVLVYHQGLIWQPVIREGSAEVGID